jgi:hypothetical protein
VIRPWVVDVVVVGGALVLAWVTFLVLVSQPLRPVDEPVQRPAVVSEPAPEMRWYGG